MKVEENGAIGHSRQAKGCCWRKGMGVRPTHLPSQDTKQFGSAEKKRPTT